MPIVRIDEKGRIQLPQALRDQWRLKPRQALVIEASGDAISVRKAKKLDPKTQSHSSDCWRYAHASRPIASPYIPERPLSTIELDIQYLEGKAQNLGGGEPLYGDDGLG